MGENGGIIIMNDSGENDLQLYFAKCYTKTTPSGAFVHICSIRFPFVSPASSRQVYQQIEKAGDRGAWSKSLKDQTKLQQHTITKAPGPPGWCHEAADGWLMAVDAVEHQQSSQALGKNTEKFKAQRSLGVTGAK